MDTGSQHEAGSRLPHGVPTDLPIRRYKVPTCPKRNRIRVYLRSGKWRGIFM